MPPAYVIDGYNLLLRAYASLLDGRSLAQAREALGARLEDFLHVSAAGTTVLTVYDGARGVFAPPARSSVAVLFTRPPESADERIVEICRVRGGDGAVCVVTSDFVDIARKLRGLRCAHRTSEDFARHVEEALRPVTRPDPEPEADKPRGSSVGEREEWMREFGFSGAED